MKEENWSARCAPLGATNFVNCMEVYDLESKFRIPKILFFQRSHKQVYTRFSLLKLKINNSLRLKFELIWSLFFIK